MTHTWPQIREILKKTVNPGLFKVWLAPLTAEISGQTLYINAPNEFVAAWVRERLAEAIGEAASTVLGRRPDIVVKAAHQPQAATVAAPALAGPARVLKTDQRADALAEESQLGLPGLAQPGRRKAWRFSFDDFVVGPSNELAYVASKGLCNQTLSSEQLYINSSPGLGKTHLLQAVGGALCGASNRKQVSVEYLTAEEFANQLILAIRAREMDRFKARYRDNVDVLLLEDIHFFQGKQKLQDELLATLKSLRATGAKIVLTSSFLPRELKDIDEGLASRFGAGFLATIERPDLATRKRILEHKAKLFQVVLPERVTELLADRIKSDVRQLESCLQNLVLKAKLLNRAITEDMAWNVLGNYDTGEPDLDMERIVSFVCKTFELSKDQLGSKSRKRQVVIARNTAFFLARKHTDMSLKDIGDTFNRKHSTVIKGITNVERELSLETPLGRQLSRTMEQVRRG